MELLLKTGAQVEGVDNCNRTPLFLAAGGGYADCVRVLLKAGAAAKIDEPGTTDCVDTRGRTPLLIAAARGHLEASNP